MEYNTCNAGTDHCSLRHLSMVWTDELDMQASRRGPDFLCIGAQKSGTTWLYDNLVGHPSVWMPPVKEIRFFDLVCPNEALLGVETPDFPSGLKRYKPTLNRPSVAALKWLYRFYNHHRSIRWYYQLFDQCSADRLTGDITPSYSTLDERGVRFARRVLRPDCKVLVILRNPIERNWSALKMLYRWKGIDIESVTLDYLRINLESPSFQLRTDYSQMLHLWTSFFGDHFKYYFYDDLVENPEQFFLDVQAFVGIKPWKNSKGVFRKSNADERSLSIPPLIHNYLKEMYGAEIERLEEFKPGIARRWLG